MDDRQPNPACPPTAVGTWRRRPPTAPNSSTNPGKSPPPGRSCPPARRSGPGKRRQNTRPLGLDRPHSFMDDRELPDGAGSGGGAVTALRTEASLLRTLARGCYTLPELYQLAERAGLADRSGGRRIIQDGQEQYKRRVRSALQALKRHGRARQAGTGRATRPFGGALDQPRRPAASRVAGLVAERAVAG